MQNIIILKILKYLSSSTVIVTALYSFYLYFHLTTIERVLLDKKNKFYFFISYWTIFIAASVFLLYISSGYYSWLIFLELGLLLSLSCLAIAAKDIITFEYNGSKYKLISTTKDNKIIALNVARPTSIILPKDFLDGRELHEEFTLNHSKEHKKHS